MAPRHIDEFPAFVHRPITDPSSCIRLLKLLPGAPDSTIQLQLATFDLDATPPFNGISYTWGEEQMRPLLIDERRLQVRQNCYYALYQARLHHAREYVWIDSICIDQENIEEKNRQVQMMGKIYATASRVLACVGPHDKDSETLLKLVSQLDKFPTRQSAENDIKVLDSWLQSMGGTAGHVSMDSITLTEDLAFFWDDYDKVMEQWVPNFGDMEKGLLSQLIKSYQNFHDRTYWHRLWIIQEIASANGELRILCGTSSLSWHAVGNCIPIINDLSRNLHTLTREIPLAKGLSGMSVVYNSARRTRDIGSIVREFHAFRCKDIRDRIFGLLSLIDWPANSAPILPDYSISITNLALAMVQYCKSEDVIYVLTALELCGSNGFDIGELTKKRQQSNSIRWDLKPFDSNDEIIDLDLPRKRKKSRKKQKSDPVALNTGNSSHPNEVDRSQQTGLSLDCCQFLTVMWQTDEEVYICAESIPSLSYEPSHLQQRIEYLREQFHPPKLLKWGTQVLGFICREARAGDSLVSWHKERPRLLLVTRDSIVIGQAFILDDELLGNMSKDYAIENASLEYTSAPFELSFDLNVTIEDVLVLYGQDHVNAKHPESRYSCEQRFNRLITNPITCTQSGNRRFTIRERIERMPVNAATSVNGKVKSEMLYDAVAQGRAMEAQRLIDSGIDINGPGGIFGNALQMACRMDDKKCLQILLDAGADVNAGREPDGNALYLASEEGRENILHMLISRGADVNAPGGYFGTALHVALVKGRKKIAKILMDHGAHINPEAASGRVLRETSAEGYDNIVQILVDAGVDVNAKSEFGYNALYTAAGLGRSKVVQVLIDAKVDINAQGGTYFNALQAAASGGHEEIVQMLLDAGVYINAQGGRCSNALEAAAKGGHSKIVKMLVDRGVDVNALRGPHFDHLQERSRNSSTKRELGKTEWDERRWYEMEEPYEIIEL